MFFWVKSDVKGKNVMGDFSVHRCRANLYTKGVSYYTLSCKTSETE